MLRRVSILLVLLVSGGAAAAAPGALQTDQVFRRFADRVAQVRIVDQAAGSKSVIGSGFFADAPGYLVTNYHVVSDIVHHPEQYRAELVRDDGSTQSLRLLNLDVIHDLAILYAERGDKAVFAFSTTATAMSTSAPSST